MKHLIVFLLSIQLLHCATVKKNGKVGTVNRLGRNVDQLLDSFQQVTSENCQGGPAENVNNNIALNYGLWEEFTPIATKSANLMSAYLTENKCSVASLSDAFYFNEITSNTMDDPRLFSSSIILRPGLHPRKRLWTPYAFKSGGGIEQIDLGEIYDYTTPGTPFWDRPSTKNYDDVSLVKTVKKSKGSKDVKKELPVATRKDGLWTPAFFDCGGGNAWLTTHTSPILCRDCKAKSNTFEGVAAFDIDLSNKDINQCSYDDDKSKTKDAFNDIFRGTARCQDTTQCMSKSGVGLRRGGYECVCKKGYYFPGHGYKKAFDGAVIEHAYKTGGDLSKFKCLPCKAGCDECTNGKSCVNQNEYKENKYNKWYGAAEKMHNSESSYNEFSGNDYVEKEW